MVIVVKRESAVNVSAANPKITDTPKISVKALGDPPDWDWALFVLAILAGGVASVVVLYYASQLAWRR